MRAKFLMATAGLLLGLLTAPAYAHPDDGTPASEFEQLEQLERQGTPRDRDAAGVRDREGRLAPQIFPPDRLTRRWLLGISAENLDTGVLVTRVYPRTAADRAGLERDDIIVSVDGYQVGLVNGRLYGLGRELQLRASPRGDVRLLVWNHRNGRLQNINVRLDPAGSGGPGFPNRPGDREFEVVVGRAHLPIEGERPPLFSTLTVRLVELSRRGRPGAVLAETTIPSPRSERVEFQLRYRTRDIDDNGRYGIEATVDARGRTLYATDRPERFRPGDGTVDVYLEPVR